MMKYGKSISVEELFEPVLCALRCRWRRKQALLLLSLQTGEVAYWQNGEHSWQEQLNEECLADKQRLTDALREILLARDVEEGAAVLLLPAAATVYSEQLLLPLMHQRELQAALQWEVQQSVPWMHEDYTYSFEAHVIGEAGNKNHRQHLFAISASASHSAKPQACPPSACCLDECFELVPAFAGVAACYSSSDYALPAALISFAYPIA